MNPDARFANDHGENYDEENDVANDEGGIGNDYDDDVTEQGCKVDRGDQEIVTGVHYKPLSFSRT